MLSLGPALVALSLPSRTAHIKMQEAFSPLALLGDAYDGALNSLIGPLGLEEAGGAELEQGVAMTFARGSAGVHFMQVAGGSCVMMQLTCWAPPEGDVPHYVCQVHVDGPAKRVTLRRDFVPRSPAGRAAPPARSRRTPWSPSPISRGRRQSSAPARRARAARNLAAA